jgi:hypothetical protein
MNKPIEFELMDHLIDARYAKSEEAMREALHVGSKLRTRILKENKGMSFCDFIRINISSSSDEKDCSDVAAINRRLDESYEREEKKRQERWNKLLDPSTKAEDIVKE